MKYTVILSPTDSREIEIAFFNIARKRAEHRIAEALYEPVGKVKALSETLSEDAFLMARVGCAPMLACADGENLPTIEEMLGMYHEDFNDWYEKFLKVNPREGAAPENLSEPEKKKEGK